MGYVSKENIGVKSKNVNDPFHAFRRFRHIGLTSISYTLALSELYDGKYYTSCIHFPRTFFSVIPILGWVDLGPL